MDDERAVTKLSIKGYKSIRSIENFDLGPLNVVIGANGAGKSNLIGFFVLLGAMVRQGLGLAVELAGGADRLLYLGAATTKELVADLRFGRNGYRFALAPTADNRLIVVNEEVGFFGFQGDPAVWNTIARGSVEAKLKDHRLDQTRRGGRAIPAWVYDAVSSWTAYHFHDTSPSAASRREHTARNHETLLPDAANLAAFLLEQRSSRPRSYEAIRDSVRLVAPFFDDFLLRPRLRGGDETVILEWTQKGSNYPFHPSQLSDGTLRFMCLATALLQPRPPATVLIDEPELGLHPYALGLIAALVKQASTRTQVIISTQSPTFLSHFDPEDVIVVDRADGQSTFTRLKSEDLQAWLEDFTLGELWQKNAILGGPVHE